MLQRNSIKQKMARIKKGLVSMIRPLSSLPSPLCSPHPKGPKAQLPSSSSMRAVSSEQRARPRTGLPPASAAEKVKVCPLQPCTVVCTTRDPRKRTKYCAKCCTVQCVVAAGLVLVSIHSGPPVQHQCTTPWPPSMAKMPPKGFRHNNKPLVWWPPGPRAVPVLQYCTVIVR